MDEEKIWEEIGLLGPMYPKDDWEGSENRLALFFKFRFGQEPAYLEERGHPKLRMRHMPFRIGEAERDRWLELMAAALEEEKISAEATASLMTFFSGVADFMRNK